MYAALLLYINLETNEYVLLLEDLAPARSRDLDENCSFVEAEEAIRQIAIFHATWWGSPQLTEMNWLFRFDENYVKVLQDLYQARWPVFLEKAGDRLPVGLQPLGEELTRNKSNLLSYLDRPPLTIVDLDYKLDNLFFASPQGGRPFAVTDWQLVGQARGVYDVAFFLCSSLSNTDFQVKAMDLLQRYYTLLIERGVRGYSFEQCLSDYHLCNLAGFIRMVVVVGGGFFNEATETTIFNGWLPRLSTAIIDLDVESLLADLQRWNSEGTLR